DDELAATDVEVDATQRMHLDLAGSIDLAQATDLEDGWRGGLAARGFDRHGPRRYGIPDQARSTWRHRVTIALIQFILDCFPIVCATCKRAAASPPGEPAFT